MPRKPPSSVSTQHEDDLRSLRESEAKLAEAGRIAQIGYWENDLVADRITWSDETYRILGLDPRGGIPDHAAFVAIIHPEDRQLQADVSARAQRGEGRYDLEYRIRRPNGEVRTLHSVGDLVTDASGRPQRAFGIVQDITERRETERALRENLGLLRAIVDGTADAIFVKDLAGRYLMMNGAGTRILQRPIAEVIGRSDAELLAPEPAAALSAQDREVFQSGESQVFEEQWTVDGEPRNYVVTKGVYRDARGEPIGLVGISSDVTRLKLLEEQFRQAQKMEAVGRLAGGVAHDFNNLLTVINSYAALAFEELAPDDPVREYLAEIGKAGDRAAGLTRQLLAFSRKQVLQPKTVNLNALLEELLKLLKRLIGADVALSISADPSLELTKVDPGQFDQAIINLAVNARDAMPDGGRLTVETRNVELGATHVAQMIDVRPGHYVVVSVRDTGIGMDRGTQARIFEPFFTTKAAGEGTGLGLAMVYGFVKQSGGHVAVESETGVGTTFHVYLPRTTEGAATARAASAAPSIPTGTETILLVEDEEMVRMLSRRVLESSGYTVLEARDGADGLQVAERYPLPIDILVTDLVMPHISGRQLSDMLVEARPAVRVLFMSGYTEDVVRHQGIREISGAFLQKPFIPADLVRRVREVLDAR